jgi:tyrosine-protein phosphatase SIW14
LKRREFLCAAIALSATASTAVARPEFWAQPVKLKGVNNLHRVTNTLYRGAQPSRIGFVNLEGKLAIATVLDLQVRHDRDDKVLASDTHLKLVKVPMVAWNVDDDDGEQLVKALKLIREGIKTGKVFVHCTHGADRTGIVMALWRMVEQDWTAEQAMAEMRNGGFHFHELFSGIPKYLMKVDIAALRQRIDG